MSGDHFDSNYVSHIEYIANGIEDYLYGHETDDCEYGEAEDRIGRECLGILQVK